MNPTLVNDWWMSTDTILGSYVVTTQLPTNAQRYNAKKIYDYLVTEKGWTAQSVCGILGNMQHESTLNPAFIEGIHRDELPNSARSLSDVPNSVMIDFHRTTRRCGIGLVQWDGTNGDGDQKLVAFAERYDMNWYDGDTQTFRIFREYETDIQFTPHDMFDKHWTWETFVTSTDSPENLARVFQYCYEVSTSSEGRDINARWWYNYLVGGLKLTTIIMAMKKPKLKKRRLII